MKTYRIYIRNAKTKYCWYDMGTTRANSENEVWAEIYKMSDRCPDSEFKFEEYKVEN